MAPVVFTNIHISFNTHNLQVCVQEEQQCVARGLSDHHQQGSGYNACCVWSHTEAAGLIYTSHVRDVTTNCCMEIILLEYI